MDPSRVEADRMEELLEWRRPSTDGLWDLCLVCALLGSALLPPPLTVEESRDPCESSLMVYASIRSSISRVWAGCWPFGGRPAFTRRSVTISALRSR